MGGCIAFIIWGFGGSLALFCVWALILRLAPWTLTIRDAIYGAIVLTMLAARRLSVARYAASAESGAVLTAKDFRRYALRLLIVSLIGWVIAQSLSFGGAHAGA